MYIRLPFVFTSLAILAFSQTCPPVNLQTTPRVVASSKQTVLTTRQSDGSFTGYLGPRLPPFLVGSEIANFQKSITSCYPFNGKKGSASFSSFIRDGWASTLGDSTDLDGDGILDAVLIAYKPNATFVVLMAGSNVPKTAPAPMVLPGPPKTVRAVDVNKDGRPDLVISTGDASTGNPLASIYVMLNNGNGTFGSPTSFPAGANPGSFAVIDVNKDGNPDLVVADQGGSDGSGGAVAILIGTGTGNFSSPTYLQTSSVSVQSVVVGDFNGDGNLDVAAATGSNVRIFTGNGSGSFTATGTLYPTGGDTAYLAMGDFNGDGKLDLVCSNYNEQTASVLLNNGSGGFLPPVSYVISRGRSVDYLVVTDFNNDGVPDIIGGTGRPDVIAGNSNNAIDVLLGNGDGTFAAPPITSVSTTNPTAFAIAGDFNGDGKMDVAAMAQRSTSVLFYAGRGDGTFAAPVSTNLGPTFSGPIGAIAADFNGDGVPDLAVLTTGGFGIALSQKNGSFQALNQIYLSALNINSLAVGDFNGDGKIDIATTLCSTNGGPSPVHVYNGTGTGSFNDSQPFRVNYCPSGFLGLDLNGDKKADIVSLNNAGPGSSVDIFMNQGQGVFGAARSYGLDPLGGVVMSIVDMNGDGAPDIVGVSNFSKPFAVSALLNNGDGTFANRVATVLDTPPIAVVGADLNGDRKGDLVLVPNGGGSDSASNDLTIAVGVGDGTVLTPVHYAGPNTTALQFADFNGDGRPDLLAASSGNAPQGYFSLMLTGAPFSAPAPSVATVNAASSAAGAPLAAESIASAFGSNLAVTANPGGTTVSVKDSAGTSRNSQVFYASSGQVNFLVPAGTANGPATITITSADGTATSGNFQIVNVAPGLFMAQGTNLYAGSILRVQADGTQSSENNYQLGSNGNILPLPVNIGSDQIYLIMYATGMRHAANVTATVAGQNVPVAFAGPQGSFAGEDQINIGPLPQSLAGAGTANIVITGDGQAANTVTVAIQ